MMLRCPTTAPGKSKQRKRGTKVERCPYCVRGAIGGIWVGSGGQARRWAPSRNHLLVGHANRSCPGQWRRTLTQPQNTQQHFGFLVQRSSTVEDL